MQTAEETETPLTKKEIYVAGVAARDAIRAKKRTEALAAVKERQARKTEVAQKVRERRQQMLKIYDELGSYAAGAKVAELSLERFRCLVLRAKRETETTA